MPLPVPSQLELIRSKGYPGEEHWATTVDNYTLGMHRIPTGRENTTKGQRSRD